MNTVAKSKVEKIINKEIQEKIDGYKRKRENELDALIKKHEKQPSKEALAIHAKLTQNKREQERLKKELEAVGFKLALN